jgi:hypothetical protein
LPQIAETASKPLGVSQVEPKYALKIRRLCFAGRRAWQIMRGVVQSGVPVLRSFDIGLKP